MQGESRPVHNVILLRGATLWLLLALILAWCLAGLNFGLPVLEGIFPGKFTRVLQAHVDFLLMSALLFGFYAAGRALPWHVRWSMVIGAFTNPSLFLLMAVFPALDAATAAEGALPALFRSLALVSCVVTTYGFGRGAVIVLRSTF